MVSILMEMYKFISVWFFILYPSTINNFSVQGHTLWNAWGTWETLTSRLNCDADYTSILGKWHNQLGLQFTCKRSPSSGWSPRSHRETERLWASLGICHPKPHAKFCERSHWKGRDTTQVASSFLSPSRDGDNPFVTTLPSPEMRESGRLLHKQKHPHVKSLPWKN